MSKFLKGSKVLLVAVALFLVSALFATPNGVKAEEVKAKNSIQTPEDYIKYLENYSVKDANNSGITDKASVMFSVEGAKETLKEFKALSKEKQEAYVEFINSPEKMAAFFNNDTKKLGKFANEVQLNETKVNFPEMKTAAGTRSVSHYGTLSLFGITMSQYAVEGSYSYNGSKATKHNYTSGRVVKHYNPTITTDRSDKNGYVSGGKYYGKATFYYKVGVAGYGVQIGNVHCSVSGNGNGKTSGSFWRD
ncbi:hypothetical protein [Bacillus cereus]|uniref:hypothetical protein n=1 Tax=Bacillus cereus TaxID=1396 RepID=UPI000B4AE0ED|nr:hypothetical protein [Bacillus cereus]